VKKASCSLEANHLKCRCAGLINANSRSAGAQTAHLIVSTLSLVDTNISSMPASCSTGRRLTTRTTCRNSAARLRLLACRYRQYTPAPTAATLPMPAANATGCSARLLKAPHARSLIEGVLDACGCTLVLCTRGSAAPCAAVTRTGPAKTAEVRRSADGAVNCCGNAAGIQVHGCRLVRSLFSIAWSQRA
jgi:hypothetical protein